MPTTYKVLGQTAPATATLSTLYTVPSATQACVSTVTVCNTAATATTYRIAVRPTGSTVATQHYLAYDASIPGNDSTVLTLGISLGATDVVSVYATTNTLAFGAYGAEFS